MSRTTNSGFFLQMVEARPLLSIFLSALILRLSLIFLGFHDFWGDAHHNLIMSKLTLDHNWVYSDFKDRHLTWLPLYRYWGAFLIWITGNVSLEVMNMANIFIGSFTAVAGGWLALLVSDKKAALLAGMGIALMPYLIVFSFMSMGEMMGGLMLLLWFVGVVKRNIWLIIIPAFCAALDRYELTFLIGLSVLPLWWMNERKSAIWTVVGLGSALLLWSGWSMYNAGNPLNWLLMRIESTTRSSGFYAENANVLIRFILLPLATIIQAFPIVIFFIWFRGKPKLQREFNPVFLMGFIVLSHLAFFMVAQTKIMASPETRFFVISLPLTTVWFMLLFRQERFRPFVTQRKVFLFLAITLLQLIVPFYRQYNLQPRREVGYWMREHLDDSAKVWSDMAVSIVESKKNYHNFYSSEVLIPEKREADINEFANRLKQENIEYVTSYPAPFDFSSFLIPELNQHEPFEWQGITFVPVYVYKPYIMETASLHSYLRYRFEEVVKPASIWRIYVP